MKKFLLMLMVAFFAVSCTSVKKTATTQNVAAPITAAVTSDLEVSNKKIVYTYYPSKSIRCGGLKNVKAAAIAEALKMNGSGDILVEPQMEVVERVGLFKKIKSVTVSGYPATYKNFKTVDSETLKKMMVNSGSCCRE